MSSKEPRRYEPRPGSIPTLVVPDPSGWRRLHLVGIGGAGMSGLARLLLARGVEVSGSDLKGSRALESLAEAGARVAVGHDPDRVPTDVDAVVLSSAIAMSNPEVRRARDLGVAILTRAQVLAALMRGARGVAVAGTHGKTTTTSMIAVTLSRAGLEPTYVVGGDLNESGSGAVHGSGDLFVAESDESDGSFLLLEPDVAVITNVEADHLDFYADATEIEAAFRAFAARAGTVVACADDPGTRRALRGCPRPVVWYGTGGDADALIAASEPRGNGTRSVLRWRGSEATLDLALPGFHNVLNGAAAVVASAVVGVPFEDAAVALASFTGVRRRFESRGEAAGARFVDDYAHHPTEVAATLTAARASAGSGGRIVAVFQPHRYSRTQAMWRELGESLTAADVVVLTDVYAAGEVPIPGVSGKLVVDAASESMPGRRVVYLPHRMDLAPFLAREARGGDLILTLGAGDVTMVPDETIARILAGAAADPAAVAEEPAG